MSNAFLKLLNDCDFDFFSPSEHLDKLIFSKNLTIAS